MAHLSMSITDTCLLWSQAVGAHNTKVSMLTAMSAVIRSEGSLLRSRDTTFLTPTGALTNTENTEVHAHVLFQNKAALCIVNIKIAIQWITLGYV